MKIASLMQPQHCRTIQMCFVFLMIGAGHSQACEDRQVWSVGSHIATLNAFSRDLQGYQSLGVEAKLEERRESRRWKCGWLWKCSNNNVDMPRGTTLIAEFYGKNAQGYPVMFDRLEESCSGRERCRIRKYAVGAKITISNSGNVNDVSGMAELIVSGVVGQVSGLGAYPTVCKGSVPQNVSGPGFPNIPSLPPQRVPDTSERRDTPRDAPDVPLNDWFDDRCRRIADGTPARFLCP